MKNCVASAQRKTARIRALMAFQRNVSITSNFTGMRPLLIHFNGPTGIGQSDVSIYFLCTVKETAPDYFSDF
jgi:hypothetical protein